MKSVIGILMLTILAISVFSQEFELPKNYKFSTKEDFAKYEADILKGIGWLTTTPIQNQPAKRKEVNTFVMEWLTGSPTVTVEISSDIVTFMDSNPDLLMIFMCGWAKYSIETKDNKNKITGNQKGIEAVIDFYTMNREYLKKDKNVEKYIKMKEKGTLIDYITKNV